MNNGSNKKYRTVYYIRSKHIHSKGRTEKKLEKKRGYVAIEISRANERKLPYKKGKNEQKKNLYLYNQNFPHDNNKLPTCNAKNYSRKKNNNTWTKELFEKFTNVTKEINKKLSSLLGIFFFRSNYFSDKLKIENEKITEKVSIYSNGGNQHIHLNHSNMEKFRNVVQSFTKKKLQNNCNKYLIGDNKIFNFQDVKDENYKMNNHVNIIADNFIKYNFFNDLYNNNNNNNNIPYNSSTWNYYTPSNGIYSDENIDKPITETEKNNNMQNIKNFYISVINKKTNKKRIKKISLMELSKEPYFFFSQNFLSNLESYLALNHCLLYIKKNHGKMSQVYNNFFSTLINIDDVKFLEENVSTSILRHIVKRLNSLFQIPTNDISSIEFCLYLKSNLDEEEEECTYFIEQNTYKYSILIFLNSQNGNYVEFPNSGIKIIPDVGNCLIYECNRNDFGSNIFKFDISEDKMFFLKLNIVHNISTHNLFKSETTNVNKRNNEISKQKEFLELYGNLFKGQNTDSSYEFIKNNFATPSINNSEKMINHYYYVKKNIDTINQKLMQLNIDHMKNLYLKSANKFKNNMHYADISNNFKRQTIFNK